MPFRLSLLFAFLLSFSAFGQEDDPRIKTVQFYPKTEITNETIFPPILSLAQKVPLVLEFDVVGNESENMIARIEHCNADWTKSFLQPLDYLEDYNEFNLNNYEFSTSTRINFTHFSFTIPKVTVSGNYLLKVYDLNEKLLLTRRFCIFEEVAEITVDPTFLTTPGRPFQRINFTVSHPSLDIFNPTENVKVVIRQNARWDNCIHSLRPSFIRPNEHILEYKHFSGEMSFLAGNEFRVFDMRALRFRGLNVQAISDTTTPRQVLLVPDVPQARNYLSRQDINGQYIIDNYDFGNGALESDYILTHFHLKSPKFNKGKVYVFGALSDWKFKPAFQMKYDDEHQAYYCSTLLKQGYYNYRYVLLDGDGSDESTLEGNHWQTSNAYDILVYYKAPEDRADRLIAYKPFTVNQ